MTYSTNFCEEYKTRERQHIFHQPEYVTSWDDLSEEYRDNMSDDEISGYLVDPDGEKRREAEWDTWQSEHLKNCSNGACHALYLRRVDAGIQK